MFAPGKGSETRKKISKKDGELTNEMKVKVEELLAEFKKDAETVRENANEFMENGKSVVDKTTLS